MRTLSTINVCISVVLALVIATIYVLLSALTPMQLDDYSFASVYMEHNGGDTSFSITAFCGMISEMWKNDNIRLSNILAPFSTVISPWCYIFPFLTGISLLVTILLILRFGFGKNFWRDPCNLSIVWLLFTLFIPWRNNLFVADYSLNYFYAGVVTLFFIFLIVINWRAKGDRADILKTALLSIFAVPAGAFHEGFVLPAGCALLAVWVLFGRRRGGAFFQCRPHTLIPVVVYLVVSLAVTINPGMIHRAMGDTRTYGYSILKLAVDYAMPASLWMVVGILALMSVKKKGIRRLVGKVFVNEVFVLFLIISLLSATFSFVTAHSTRMAYWPTVASMIAWLILCRTLYSEYKEPPFFRFIWDVRIKKVMAVAALLFSGTIYSFALISQYHYWGENEEILQLMENTEDGTVYYDVLQPEEVSPLSLYIPARSKWIYSFNYEKLWDYLKVRKDGVKSNKMGIRPAVVPVSLEYFSPRFEDTGAPQYSPNGDVVFSKEVASTPSEVMFCVESEVREPGMLLPYTNYYGDTLVYARTYRTLPPALRIRTIIDK